MAEFKVTAAAVVAKVEDARREVYFYRGAVLPPIVSEAEARRLVAVGLVAEITDGPSAPEPQTPPPGNASGDGKALDPSGDGGAPVEPQTPPAGDGAEVDIDGLTVAQLRDYAKAHEIALNGAISKDDLRAVIKAASQATQA